MSFDNSRLLLELENYREGVNKQVMKSEVGDLSLSTLKAIAVTLAQSRGAYVAVLQGLSPSLEDQSVTQEQLVQLNGKQRLYEELQQASKTLDTALESAYIEVEA